MKINPVFTSFIAIDDLNINNKEIVDRCYELRNTDPNGRIISNVGGWQSNNIDLKWFPELYSEVSKRLQELHYYFEFKDQQVTKITDAWININEPMNYNAPHDHGGGLFSGAYYVNAEDDMGDITFITPIGAHTFCISGNLVKTFNPFNSNVQTVKPKTGTLVLFPSWLVHYTGPNLSNKNRISISFNSHMV